MMPDEYMPMNWPWFWAAVQGQPDFVVVAYLRLLSHYWHHNHCKGLRNDETFLKEVCKLEGNEWERAKFILFNGGEFFTTRGPVFHQKRALAEWTKSMNRYNAVKLRAVKASAARWMK